MKKIWIDGFEANVPQRVGSGQVAFELLKNIERVDKRNDFTVLLASNPLPDLPKERENWRYKIIRPNRLKTLVSIPLALFASKQRPDVIFSPTHYIPRFSPVKRVGMIFDLSFLHFPEMFNKKDLYQLTTWSKFTILNADRIITISKFSRDDIIKNYKAFFSSEGDLRKKISVSYPGKDENTFKPINDVKKIESVKDKYKVMGDYIIYIGTVQPRKNLKRLIESFQKIENLKLVIVGKTKGPGRQAWMFEEILNLPKQLKIEEKVVFTGFVPTEELPYLLQGAKAFVLPSLWEGFGIPPVEAMASGVPVIVSNVSSLPEVVGDAGLTVDPNSIDQIEQAIRTISSDKKLREKLSKKGLERAKFFSNENMAKTVLSVLEDT